MKILHTLASLDGSSGGPARSVPQLALALANLGHEVGLWCPDRRTSNLADFSSDELGKIRWFSGPFEAACASFGEPDLVHDHGIWLPLHRRVATVCGERKIPRIVSPRGMLEPWALRHKRWKKRFAWMLYQKHSLQTVNGLHATAEQEARHMRALGLRSPIAVVANGVSSPKALDGKSDQTSKTLDLGSTRTALFLSRVHKKKGLPMWLEAWSRVRPEGWRMRVIGPEEDGHRAEMESMVHRAGLLESWSFEEAMEGQAKWRVFAGADLFVLPSHSENFGIVVAEALASGLPVITTTGTPWRTLHDHDCGWCVDPTVDALEQAFREALIRTGEYTQMGARGRVWMETEFAWSGIAAKMEDAYEWVLGSGCKPDFVF